MIFEPLQLAVERSKTSDQGLMAVTWGFGEEDRLERHQVVGEEIILREPVPESLHGQFARSQRIEKRSARSPTHSCPAFRISS
jgi:hypothetical protein